MTSVTPLCQAPRARAAIRKPDVFIVGAPKCGTTAMASYLGAHPEIFMARKEMHFLGSDLRFGTQFYRRPLKAYLTEFSERNGERRAGDASVWHLFSTRAAAEIHAFNPASRIIIMLREPTEMLHSLYHHFLYDGNEHLPTFEQALAAEAERRAGRQVTRQTYFTQGLVYRDTVRYYEQVRRYLDVFEREQVHIVIYDDLAANASVTYRETLDFLKVDPNCGETEFKIVNGNKGVRHPMLRAVIRDRGLRSTIIAMRPWLPQPVLTALYQVESRLQRFNSRPEKRPAMAPELRRRLKAEFAPDVERLSELLGRDLTHWSQ